MIFFHRTYAKLLLTVCFASSPQPLVAAEPAKPKQNPVAKAVTKPHQSTSGAKHSVISGSGYQQLLQPLNIFATPASAKRLITLQELYSLIKARGATLKVSKETLNIAKQNSKLENNKKLPVLSMDLGHQQSWAKTKADSDATDDYADRDDVSGARSLSSNAGLTLSGSPMTGLNYKVTFPNLANSQTQPEASPGNPPRHDKAAFNASTDIALIKDNPLTAESLNRKKRNLTLAIAKETYKADIIKAIAAGETTFYDLIKKHHQFMVQERALLLAKALESDVKEKINAGESSALEAMRAELQTVQTETDNMSGQIDFSSAMEEFRNSLSYSSEEGEGIFPDPKSLDVNLDRIVIPANAVDTIRKNNAELSIIQMQKQSAEIDLALARNATSPGLSFTTSYANAAPGEGWPKTAMEATRPNDRTFSVGLTYTQILYNNTAKDSLQQAIVAKQKAEYAIDETERRILKEYSALVKKLDIGARRLKIAKISREMAERKLASEYEKFKVGESSVRTVIDSQTEVNSARISELGARVELLLGQGQLRTLLGQLPDNTSVDDGGP